ncbi:MAG: ABC transporter substrate-binding protein [Clostridia bacterium]|nr:ABC transporter substrate-binding protein [Clostridia bacterium]
MTRRSLIVFFIVFAAISVFAVIKLYISNPGIDSYFRDKPLKTHVPSTNSHTKKTIVYSYGGTDHGGSVKEIVRLFQKENPDVEVKLQQLPSSTDYQRNAYKLALSSGDDSFDVFNADLVWTAEFASANWILPLDSFFISGDRRMFLPNTIESCTYNNKIYAVPHRTDASLLYYRSDIIFNPPKTYKDLIDMSKKYMSTPGIKYGYVFQGKSYEGLVCNALEFIWNNGGEIVKDGKVVINSPEAIEGLQIFIDIANSNITSPDVLTFEEEDARLAFQDGTAIFMRNWAFAYKQLNNMYNSEVKGNVGVCNLPLGPKGKKSIMALGGWNYMMNGHTKNQELAWKFIKWASSYEMQIVDSVMGGYIPTRQSAYNNSEVLKINPWISQFKSSIGTAKLRPVSPGYSSISESMQVNFSSALVKKIDAKTAIENIEKDLLRIYNKKSRD